MRPYTSERPVEGPSIMITYQGSATSDYFDKINQFLQLLL